MRQTSWPCRPGVANFISGLLTGTEVFMTDPVSSGANRFFQKILDSAHAGLTNEASPAQRFNFETAVPVHSVPMALSDDFAAPSGLDITDGPIAKDAKSGFFQNGSTPMTDTQDRGERGPLSGGFSGSRSGADAVGSAIESSWDTHVGSIEHMEVGHASGLELPSSTDCIESGVSKPPESNQVMFFGSKVERYVDVKDRGKQAMLSQDHEKHGMGPNGLDNESVGLPPPSSNPVDTEQPNAATVKASDTAEIETASAAQKGQTTSASDPGDRSSQKQRLTAIDTEGIQISSGHHVSAPKPGFKGANRFDRPPSSLFDPAPSQQGSPARIPGPKDLAAGRAAAAENTKSPIKARWVAKTGDDGLEPHRTSSSGAEIQHSDNAAPPQISEADTLVKRAHIRRPSKKMPLIVRAETDSRPKPLSPADSQPLSWFKPQTTPQPKMPPGDPQVQIGHIDVIVQTPQTIPKSDPKISSGLSDFASRYYLKGL
jgi:hypothetical protein